MTSSPRNTQLDISPETHEGKPGDISPDDRNRLSDFPSETQERTPEDKSHNPGNETAPTSSLADGEMEGPSTNHEDKITEEDYVVVPKHILRLVIVGKTGNGKSSLGNIILGKQAFAIGKGMSSMTVETKTEVGNNIEVVDTPDLVNCEMDEADAAKEVMQWKETEETDDRPVTTAVVVAIRCDVRYTAEEYAIYKQVKKLWGDYFCQHLVVALTFGDRLDLDPVQEKEKLKQMLGTVCQELQDVLRDADQRYVVFDCSTGRREDDRHRDSVSELKKLADSKTGTQFVQK